MQTRRIQRALIIALGGCVVGALAFPLSAGAYSLSKSTNGLIIDRESTDSTAAVNVYLHYAYSNESAGSWLTTVSVFDTTKFGSTKTLAMVGGDLGDSIEVPLQSGYRFQLIRISNNATIDKRFAILNEPMEVTVENTPTVNIGTQPAVSLSSSVSVAGTMPVEVASFREIPDGFLSSAAGMGVVALGAMAGFFTARRV